MNVLTRNVLAELLIEALDARSNPNAAAAAVRCLGAYVRSGQGAASQAPQLPVTDLLRSVSPPDQARVRVRIETCALLAFESGRPVERVTLAPDFAAQWPEIAATLLRYASVIDEWADSARESGGTSEPDAALRKAALLFNYWCFFEVHEVLEPVWMEEVGDVKRFLQGLIQAAVALYHLGRGNLAGARSLLAEGLAKLAPHRPSFLGVELEEFVAGLEACRAAVIRLRPENAVEFDTRLIPRMEYSGPPSPAGKRATWNA